MTRGAATLQAGPVEMPDGPPPRREVVSTAAGVVARIRDGDAVAIGGFVTANHPMPLVRELIRQGKKDLTVIGSATGGLEIDLLLGAGVVKKLIAPYCGAELYAPLGSCFRAMVEKEQVELWESSEYILYAGLQAKAMGQEFFAWRGGVGSSIVDLNPDLKVFTSPLGDGKEYVAVPAISPDWAFLHLGWADKYGNGQHPGARFGDRIMARAADRVALTVERLVPNSRIRANPVMTSVPYADAVVVAPFGSHPYASHGFYAEDAEHIEAYVRATAGFRKGDRSGLDAYLDKYVFGPQSHAVPYADAVVVAPFGSHPYASHGFYAEDAEHIEAYVRATAGFRKGDRSGLDAYLDKYVFGRRATTTTWTSRGSGCQFRGRAARPAGSHDRGRVFHAERIVAQQRDFEKRHAGIEQCFTPMQQHRIGVVAGRERGRAVMAVERTVAEARRNQLPGQADFAGPDDFGVPHHRKGLCHDRSERGTADHLRLQQNKPALTCEAILPFRPCHKNRLANGSAGRETRSPRGP